MTDRNLRRQLRWCGRAQWMLPAGTAGICLVLLAIMASARARMAALQKQQATAWRTIQRCSTEAAQLPQVRRHLEQAALVQRQWQQRLPHQPDLVLTIAWLQELARQQGASDFQWHLPAQPQANSSGGGAVAAMPLVVELRCPADALARLVRQIESGPRPIAVAELGFVTEPGGHELRVELELNVLFCRSSPGR